MAKASKHGAGVNARRMQGGPIERRRRLGRFRHSGERLGDAFRRFDDVGRSALSKRVAARLAIELRMALDEETVDSPRAVAKAVEERWQGRERLSVLADLPTRKAEAPGRAFEPKELAVLTFRVDRRARRAEQPRKIVRTQHVRVAENLGDPPPAALARRRERSIEIRTGDLWCCIDHRGFGGGVDFPDFQRALRLDVDHQAKGPPGSLHSLERGAEGLDKLSDPLAVARQRTDCLGRNRDCRSSVWDGVSVEHKGAAPGCAIGGDLYGPPLRGLRSGDRHGILLTPELWGAARRSSSS